MKIDGVDLAGCDILCIHRYVSAPKPELVVQVALIAEDEEVKEMLAKHGVVSQTTDEVRPIKILSAACLTWIYSQLGKNEKLGNELIFLLRSSQFSELVRIARKEYVGSGVSRTVAPYPSRRNR